MNITNTINLYKGLCKLYQIVKDTDYESPYQQGLCKNVLYLTDYPILYNAVLLFLKLELPVRQYGFDSSYSWPQSDKQARLNWLNQQIAYLEFELTEEGIDIKTL